LARAGLSWQGNYFEHQLRPDDSIEDVLRYLFLNPYRADLLSPLEVYPHYWICAQDSEWFEKTVDAGRPFPEWLASG
jgi:hypothetical protein